MTVERRVPHVREVAVAGDFALIGGYSAWFLARVLAGYPGGLERLVARSGLPPERRADVMRALAALQEAGARWQLGRISTSGSPEVDGTDADVRSKRASSRSELSLLSAGDVAGVLGVSDRRVRQLVSEGRLTAERDAGGRLRFERADVAAFVERRLIEKEPHEKRPH